MIWTLRIGPVVHRESIPLSQVEHLRATTLRLDHARHRYDFVRRSADAALFAVPASYQAAVVTKGSVVIRRGNAEIAYRASLGAIAFLTFWFGLLVAGEIGIWFLPSGRPLALALLLAALMAGAALLVRHAIRAEISRSAGYSPGGGEAADHVECRDARVLMTSSLQRITVLGIACTLLGSRLAAQAADPILGTWVLNVARSTFSPGPAPRSETRTYVLQTSRQLTALAPQDIRWFTPSYYTDGRERAQLLGDSGKGGPWIDRVRIPGGSRVLAHTHPQDEVVTVIEGTWYEPAALSRDARGARHRSGQR